MPNVKKSKSMDKMPARRMPEGFEFPKNKKAVPNKPTAKTTTKAPAKKSPMPKVTKKPAKMTPQDAAMKKLLEKKYGKIYG